VGGVKRHDSPPNTLVGIYIESIYGKKPRHLVYGCGFYQHGTYYRLFQFFGLWRQFAVIQNSSIRRGSADKGFFYKVNRFGHGFLYFGFRIADCGLSSHVKRK
jgi:hypothetical protein